MEDVLGLSVFPPNCVTRSPTAFSRHHETDIGDSLGALLVLNGCQSFKMCKPLFNTIVTTPGHKINTCRKNLGERILCMNTRRACIRTRTNTRKYFCGNIFRILANILGEFISVRIHAALVFAPARIQKKSW